MDAPPVAAPPVELHHARGDAAAAAEARLGIAAPTFSRAVADGYFRVLAIKDEYEVARLHTDGMLRAELAATFEGALEPHFHFAPFGRSRKRAYGPWIEPFLRVLARLRFLRGSPFDPFGYTEEHRQERRARADYEAMLDRVTPALTAANHALAAELAGMPLQVRGFGPVERRNAALAQARARELEITLGGTA